jgi:hypothetical protein
VLDPQKPGLSGPPSHLDPDCPRQGVQLCYPNLDFLTKASHLNNVELGRVPRCDLAKIVPAWDEREENYLIAAGR